MTPLERISNRLPLLLAALAVGIAFHGACVSAHADDAPLPSAIGATAKEFKEADAKYVKALCDGSKAQRSETRRTRDNLQGELGKEIADSMASDPAVQKVLDTAAAAGDTADKTAANPAASEKEKADAKAAFEKAKSDLRDVVAKERGRIASQIETQFAVKIAALESCPNEPKAAKAKSRKVAHAKRSARHSEEGGGGGGVSVGGGGAGASFSFGGGGGGGLGVSIGQ